MSYVETDFLIVVYKLFGTSVNFTKRNTICSSGFIHSSQLEKCAEEVGKWGKREKEGLTMFAVFALEPWGTYALSPGLVALSAILTDWTVFTTRQAPD